MLLLLLLLMTVCVVSYFWNRKRSEPLTPFRRGPQSIAKAWEIKKGDLSGATHSTPTETDARGIGPDRQRTR
ncbi:MAG: hypothetical protein PW734_12125 [Verrucomicrobium sp.]|nr:hypothetical protein [Verrucomicrobium sp.]